MSTGRCATWLKFMKDWTVTEISDYCSKNGWKIEIIDSPSYNEDIYWE